MTLDLLQPVMVSASKVRIRRPRSTRGISTNWALAEGLGLLVEHRGADLIAASRVEGQADAEAARRRRSGLGPDRRSQTSEPARQHPRRERHRHAPGIGEPHQRQPRLARPQRRNVQRQERIAVDRAARVEQTEPRREIVEHQVDRAGDRRRAAVGDGHHAQRHARQRVEDERQPRDPHLRRDIRRRRAQVGDHGVVIGDPRRRRGEVARRLRRVGVAAREGDPRHAGERARADEHVVEHLRVAVEDVRVALGRAARRRRGRPGPDRAGRGWRAPPRTPAPACP